MARLLLPPAKRNALWNTYAADLYEMAKGMPQGSVRRAVLAIAFAVPPAHRRRVHGFSLRDLLNARGHITYHNRPYVPSPYHLNMATLVKKYKAASDGSLHDTAKSADLHDLLAQRRKKLMAYLESVMPGDLTSGQWTGIDKAVEWISAGAVPVGLILSAKLARNSKKKKAAPAVSSK